MKNNRSRHPELETLSAYLDHQLTEAEEQALLSRLSEDKALQQQLDHLRQARYMLRQTPRVKRPRSFALSPEMVKQQRFAFRMMNVSRMVSAVASVLLIVAIGGQYLTRSGGLDASQAGENLAYMADEAADADLAEESMAMEAPVEEMEMDDAAEQAVGEAEEAPAAEMEEPAAEEAVESAEDMAPQATPTLEGTLEPGGGGGEPPGVEEEESADEGEIMGTGSGPTLTPDQAESRTIPTEKTSGEAAELEIAPVDAADGEEMLEPELPVAEMPQPEPEREISPLQIVQAALLVFALAAGLAAVYFRKQVR